jgi:molecular chaperone DnaK (HSP70)
MSSAKSLEKILGVDLGTTNSAAAIFEGGRATTISSAEGPTMANQQKGKQQQTLKEPFTKLKGKWEPTTRLTSQGKNILRNKSQRSYFRR